MKCVILAGGRGTRLQEDTEIIPKPLLMVGDKPLLHHIIDIYISYGVKDFIIPIGYKAHLIIGYFVGLKHCKVEKWDNGVINIKYSDVEISLIDTGLDTQTGGRLLRVSPYLTSPFYFTYGDGLSDVDISSLNKKYNGEAGLITVVRPLPRFGSAILDSKDMIIEFGEKEENLSGWINGGFAILTPKIFDYINGDESNLEKDVYPQLAKNGKLGAYRHEGFWKCCDTKRDLVEMNEIYKNQGAVWLK